MGTDQVLKISIFAKFTRFSNKAVLAHMITVGSHFMEINILFNTYLIPLLLKIFFNLKN